MRITQMYKSFTPLEQSQLRSKYQSLMTKCSKPILGTIFCDDNSLLKRKKILDMMIESPFLFSKYYPEFENLFTDILMNITKSYFEFPYSEQQICRGIDILDHIYEDGKGDRQNLVHIYKYINEFMTSTNETPIYYSHHLLKNDRFEYMQKRLLEVESNKNFRYDIINGIDRIKDWIFDESMLPDFFKGEDPFIVCMEAIFDSDTYHELYAKIKALQLASRKYSISETEQIIKSIFTGQYKEVVDGTVISYENNFQNLVERPTTIAARNNYLYSNLLGISCADIHNFGGSISEFLDKTLLLQKEKNEKVKKLK